MYQNMSQRSERKREQSTEIKATHLAVKIPTAQVLATATMLNEEEIIALVSEGTPLGEGYFGKAFRIRH